MGGGHDTIKTGSGNDIIAGGLGDDEIDLSGGGDDTVIYQFGRDTNGNIYAKDAAERIISFDRGNDTLVLKPNFEDDNLRTFDDYIALFKGDDGIWGNRDDQMIVSFHVEFEGADVYVPGRGNDAVVLQNDNVMQTIVYRFDSSGDEWTATDGPLTIFNFKRADANGVAGDPLLLVDINPNNPYESMDSIFRSTPDGGDANKMTFETVTTRVGGVDFVMGYIITIGNPANNNTININFSGSLSTNLFNTYRDNLNYADADQEISHVLFGDTGLLLDPLDDLKIVVYEDVKPDLI